MEDVDALVASVLPRIKEDVEGLHSGTAEPRIMLWSHRAPVTVFGNAATVCGWEEIEALSRKLARNFHGSESCEYEVLAAGGSGELAYIAGIERSVAAVGDADPAPFALRVTTVLRREDDEWKIVHRHADPYDEAAVAGRSISRSWLDAASAATAVDPPAAGSGDASPQ
jgi:ketosteroid isomerase-like protein